MSHSFSTARASTLLIASLLLASCGGGGAGGSGANAPLQPAPTSPPDTDLINTYLDTFGNPLPAFEALGPTDIPTTGSANYSGALRGELGGETIAANLNLSSSFSGNTISGTASGFVSEGGATYTGTLAGDGTISRDNGTAQPQVALTLDGQLNGAASALALDGAFLGAAGDTDIVAIGGQVEGVIGTSPLLNGAFAAR